MKNRLAPKVAGRSFRFTAMAKKKRPQQPTAPVMTRGQLSRAAQERQREQLLYRAIGGVAILIVLILAFAAYSTFISHPNEELAKVGNTSINRANYEKLRRYDLFQQLTTSQYLTNQGTDPTTVGYPAVDTLQTQLANVSKDPVDSATVAQMVDNEVLKQKAQSDFQIVPNNADLKAEAIKEFLPSPTPPTTPAPSATISGTTTLTPTVTLTPTSGPPTNTPTKTATLPPVAGASATAAAGYSSAIQAITTNAKISEQDYLDLVIAPAYLKNTVTDKVSTSVMTTTEAIHAQHILTDTEAGAQKVVMMLDQGQDFTKVANAQSSEQITREVQGGTPNGGDLGWFDKNGNELENTGQTLVKEFVDGAWPIAAGQYTKTPVKTQFGYHVIKVLERNPKYELSEAEITNRKTTAYNDWFTKAKDSMSASIKYSDKVAAPTSVPTQPAVPTVATTPLSVPTQSTGGTTPALGTATPVAGGSTPTASGPSPTP